MSRVKQFRGLVEIGRDPAKKIISEQVPLPMHFLWEIHRPIFEINTILIYIKQFINIFRYYLIHARIVLNFKFPQYVLGI